MKFRLFERNRGDDVLSQSSRKKDSHPKEFLSLRKQFKSFGHRSPKKKVQAPVNKIDIGGNDDIGKHNKDAVFGETKGSSFRQNRIFAQSLIFRETNDAFSEVENEVPRIFPRSSSSTPITALPSDNEDLSLTTHIDQYHTKGRESESSVDEYKDNLIHQVRKLRKSSSESNVYLSSGMPSLSDGRNCEARDVPVGRRQETSRAYSLNSTNRPREWGDEEKMANRNASSRRMRSYSPSAKMFVKSNVMPSDKPSHNGIIGQYRSKSYRRKKKRSTKVKVSVTKPPQTSDNVKIQERSSFANHGKRSMVLDRASREPLFVHSDTSTATNREGKNNSLLEDDSDEEDLSFSSLSVDCAPCRCNENVTSDNILYIPRRIWYHLGIQCSDSDKNSLNQVSQHDLRIAKSYIRDGDSVSTYSIQS